MKPEVCELVKQTSQAELVPIHRDSNFKYQVTSPKSIFSIPESCNHHSLESR